MDPNQQPAPFVPAPLTPVPLAPPPRKSNKKLGLILGIIGGALVLLAGVGLLIYFLISQVSKADYQAANTHYGKVAVETDKLNNLGDTFMNKLSSLKDSAAYDAFSEETKATLKSAKTQNDELAQLKAVKFGEGGKLYGAFNNKFKSSVTYKAALIDSFDKVYGAMSACRKNLDTSNVATMDVGKYYRSCSDALNATGTLPNKALETYRKDAAVHFTTMATAYTEYMNAASSKNQAALKTANDKGQAATDKLDQTAKSVKESLSIEVKSNDATEEGRALKAFLEEKSQ